MRMRDKREQSEEWQHHNHMTVNRHISDCIDDLNVDIGLDHDW